MQHLRKIEGSILVVREKFGKMGKSQECVLAYSMSQFLLRWTQNKFL